MAGMLYGNQIGAKVESMSLGGYLCAHGVVPGSVYCGTPDAVVGDDVMWAAYKQVVNVLLAAPSHPRHDYAARSPQCVGITPQ